MTALAFAAVLAFALPLAAHATAPPRDGRMAPELSAAFASGALGVPARAALPTSSLQTDWYVPVLLVGFPDSTLRYTAAEVQAALFDTTHSSPTGSMVDYYDWASGGRIRVRAEVIPIPALSHPLNFYAADAYGLNVLTTPNNDYGLVSDAIRLADPSVDWTRFDRDGDGYVDMVWIVHAGTGAEGTGNRRNFWSITSRLSNGWSRGGAVETDDFVPGSLTRHVRIDRFSMLPELSFFSPGSLSEIGVYCHEFGHALGLPDLYDTSSLGGTANVGPGNWSLMSTGSYGTDGHSPDYPSHLGAWPMLYLGWAERVRPSRDTTMVIAPLSQGGPVVELWCEGEYGTEHFLLESRARTGFDRNLPAEGMLVHQVDDAMIGGRLDANRINTGPTPGLRILEADGDFDLMTGFNRGDANDPLPGATQKHRLDDQTFPNLRTIRGAITNLALEDVALVPGGVSAHLRVVAPGWLDAEDCTDGEYTPLPGSSRGRYAVATPQGTEYLVVSEQHEGIAQIVLRSRAFSGPWSTGEVITSSPGGAYEPTVALLPGNDLAVAWTDLQGGQPQVRYRSRIRGTWTGERQLSTAPTGALAPALAADAKGRVFAAWLELHSPKPQLKLLAFTWASPFGSAATVSDTSDRPSAPAIAATADGKVMVVWPDLGSGMPLIHFARWVPDSGLRPRLRMTGTPLYSQPTCDVAADPSGSFHIVWQQLSSEVHYIRRWPVGPPSRDTLLESSGDQVQNPIIASDPLGGLHLVYERSTELGQQLRYKRARPNEGWDFRPTTISGAADGSVSRAQLMPITQGGITVLYSGFDGQLDRLRSRRRRLDGNNAAGVEPPPPVHVLAGLACAPNPARSGAMLRCSGEALRAGALVDLLDAAGRRIATRRVEANGEARFLPDDTRALSPGLYFVRERGRQGGARWVVLR